MAESRAVRCLDCGHEWDCSAEYPQCSDPNDECGRSRNVEAIGESEPTDSDTPDASSERESEIPGTASGSDSSDDSDDSGSWSPLFEAEQTETEPIDSPADTDANLFTSDDESESGDDENGVEFDAENPVPELDGDDIRMFVKTPFDMAARSRGDHWELDDDELDQLAASYANVANKWGPHMMGEYGPEILACLTTMAVVGPRLAEDKKRSEKAEKEAVDDEPDTGTERTNTEPNEPESPATEDGGFAYANV